MTTEYKRGFIITSSNMFYGTPLILIVLEQLFLVWVCIPLR